MASRKQDYKTRCALATDIGRKKDQNEDFISYYEPASFKELQESGRLYIVADGVGGAVAGEKASEYAALKVKYDYYRKPEASVRERLRDAMETASNDIFDFVENSGRFAQMATTMVAAVIRNGRLTVANVGDSRAYLIRDSQVIFETFDHTIPGERYKRGEITEDEMRDFKGKSPLTRSLGGDSEAAVDIYDDLPELQPGDRVFLCSDGLARYILKDDISELVGTGDPRKVVSECVKHANRAGGADNTSVLLVEIGEMSDNPFPAGPLEGLAPEPVDQKLLESGPFTSRGPGLPPSLHRSPSIWVRVAVISFILVVVSLVVVIGAVGGGKLRSTLTKPTVAATQATQMETQGVTEVPTSAPPPGDVAVAPPVATEQAALPAPLCVATLKQALYVRQGPGIKYDLAQAEELKPGAQVIVKGKYGDPPWWQVTSTTGLTVDGWISAGTQLGTNDYGFTSLNDECTTIPDVTADPNLPTHAVEAEATQNPAVETQAPTEPIIPSAPASETPIPSISPDTPPAQPANYSGCVYRVQKGEGLFTIAQKFGLPLGPATYQQFQLVHPVIKNDPDRIEGGLVPIADPGKLPENGNLIVPLVNIKQCQAVIGGEWKTISRCEPNDCS